MAIATWSTRQSQTAKDGLTNKGGQTCDKEVFFNGIS